MPVSFSIKNVPEEVAERVRLRAERNHRSLQRELLAILEAAVRGDIVTVASAPDRPASRLSIQQIHEEARESFPSGTPSSVEFIRQQRDGRFGLDWAGTPRRRRR